MSDFELKVYDELPEGKRVRNPVIGERLTTIQNDTRYHGKWVEVFASDDMKKATTTGASLRGRYGPVSCNGWTFATRQRPDSDEGFVLARYTPQMIKPGEFELYQKERREKDQEAAARQKAKKVEAAKKAARAEQQAQAQAAKAG